MEDRAGQESDTTFSELGSVNSGITVSTHMCLVTETVVVVVAVAEGETAMEIEVVAALTRKRRVDSFSGAPVRAVITVDTCI
jgi:hypothetical protein